MSFYKVYCCGCKSDVEARLVKGNEIYPTREDLHNLDFYICDTCKNYVGVHKGTLTPLGCIPTPKLRARRREIHEIIDPLWQRKLISRTELYSKIAFKIGVKEFHSAEINNTATASLVIKYGMELKLQLEQ